jgi:FlaA1/EpsC-like NDP-sugar epimerase
MPDRALPLRSTSRAQLKPGLPDRVVRRLRRDLPLAVLDVIIVFAAYVSVLLVRFDGPVPEGYWQGFKVFLPIVVVIHLLSNYLFGLYGQMWQHASVQEARRVVLAGATAFLMVVASSFLTGQYVLPRTVVFLGPAFALLGFGALRFQTRLFAFHRRTVKDGQVSRVLIFGTGDAGAMLLSDIQRNPSLGLLPVALIDDDPRRRGLSLHGVPVMGTRDDIPRLAERWDASQVLLAVPSATSELVRTVAERCEEAGVRLRVLPSVREIVGGKVTARDIRDLRIEDLLGRRQVDLDLGAVHDLLAGKRVLITGAGGSIGSEIARQAAGFDPALLILLDNDETHVFEVGSSLPSSIPQQQSLADVRDRDRIADIFSTFRPQVVFHAAAHKHVPLLESHPREAVLTNVVGTANVVEAAVAAGVERFVLVSTDKAIRPRSVMGASKRFAEDVVRGFVGDGTIGCAVRFGNVLGSRGSVIPTFLRQIRDGGPVTVTDPEMRRYFMSIEESVQLVLQASAIARGEEVFTLDMGEPVRILDLARNLIRLSGAIPGSDIEIEITGVRPGEKLFEDVRDDGEELLPSSHPEILVTLPPRPNMIELRAAIRSLESLCAHGRDDELAAELMTWAGRSDAMPPLAAVGGSA